MAKYNGWTNWETWHTALLIDNEYDLYLKKVSLIKKKAPLSEFKRELKKAEIMTRDFWRSNIKGLGGDNDKFEKVNWKEIHNNSMQEEY